MNISGTNIEINQGNVIYLNVWWNGNFLDGNEQENNIDLEGWIK